MALSDVSRTTIGVDRGDWGRFCPGLPAEVAAMVAPPVTVSSLPVGASAGRGKRRAATAARRRANMPAASPFGRHRRVK
jgi:hypothetical protein